MPISSLSPLGLFPSFRDCLVLTPDLITRVIGFDLSFKSLPPDSIYPYLPTALLSTMADDKKSDDYAIDMGKDSGNKEFEAASPPTPAPRSSPSAMSNHPALPVLAYCSSSIMMTVMNKYVLSGLDFNLNFLLLCVQVCCELCTESGQMTDLDSLWFALR